MSEHIADRYEVIRPLGEGGLSRVILVRDIESGELRALKRVRFADAATRDLVRNEYAALARIHHPNVVRVHEFGALPDGEAFFVMDYIEGRPLDEALAPGDVAGLLATSLQVLDGLAAIHAAGLVHCDLKPDNLLVSTDEGGAHHVRIVDFGFAERRTDQASDKVRGTPGYAAPELLAGQPYSRDSDLYALGASLYRVLSGRAAFPGRDAASILASQRRGQPGVLALRAAGVPAALDAPLLGMLAPDPPGRAAAVRAWEDLARKRGHAPRADRRASLASGPFVGRDELLSAARDSLLTGGGTKAWLLVGPHGIGKTRLSREIALEAELSGRAVVWADADSPISADRLARLGSNALLVLDDLDAWDEPDIVAASLAHASAPGLAILATGQRPPMAGDAIFRVLLTIPAPPAPDVRALGPLDPADVERLVTALLGGTPPRGLAEELVQVAGAAPGPLLEQLAYLLTSAALREEGGHWTLHASTDAPHRPRATAREGEEAWASLSEPARIAAVVQAGWPATLPVDAMAEIAGIPDGLLRQGLDELAWRGFLAPARDQRLARIAPRSFATYALREAGGGAVDAIRQRMASMFGAVLDSAHPVSAPRAALLLSAAVQHMAIGEAGRAREQLREAFQRARQSEASREIAQRAGELLLEVAGDGEERCEILAALAAFEADENHGRRAEELWREVFESGIALAPEREFGWVLARAQNLQQLLDYGAAVELIREALARLDNAGLSGAALGEAHGALGWSLQRGNRWAEALPEFERAMALLPADAVAERAILLNRYGYALCRQGQTERGDAMLLDALALAQRSGDPRIEARVLGNLGGRATDRGDAADGSRLTRTAMSLMTGAGSEQWQLVGASNLLSTANNTCNWKDWDDAYSVLEAAGRSAGDPMAFSRACDMLSDRSLRTGRLRDAIRANRMESRWLRGNTVAEYLVRNRIQRELLRGLEGRGDSACRRLRKLFMAVRTEGHPLVTLFAANCLAELHLTCGRRDLALRYVEFIERNSEGGIGIMTTCLLLHVRAAARSNDEALFQRLRPALTAHFDRMAAAGARDVEPTRQEFEAYRLAFAGDSDAAAATLSDAIAGYRRLELTPGVVRAAWGFGLLMVGRGVLRHAIPALRQAHAAAAASGCELWRSHIAEDLLAASEALPDLGTAPVVASTKSAELLPSIIEMVNSLLDLPEMLRQALRVTCETVGADRGFILLLGEHEEELIEMAHFGLIDDGARRNSVQVSRTIVRWVTRRNETFQTNAMGSDPRLGSTQSLLDVAIRSLVCVPLRLRERVIGTIYLESRAAGTAFSEPALALVDSFAHLIAVSIERSRLHDELRRSRDKVIGENLSLRREATRRFSGPNIIGQSREIEGVLSEALRVSATVASVLITGEPGTGKDLIARLIHYSSGRADRPLLSFNCAALAKDLLDAELFGTENRIATGVAARQGIFERADGATLFLDEIGEMPPDLQSKLLRVLQSRTFTRVGGSLELPTNFRLLSATNRDLLERIEAGAFRDDLYERIRQFEIHIPPLRERKADIPFLAEHFLRQFCEANGRPIPRISEAFYSVIGAEPWYNNIRQLENYVVRCAILTEGDVLDPIAPPPSKEPRKRRRPPTMAPKWLGDDPVTERSTDLKTALEETERRWITLALDEAKGNQRQAAAILGIKESTLRYRLGALEREGDEPTPQTRRHPRRSRLNS